MSQAPDARQWDTCLEQPATNAFIQWKGTDLCMDFSCECGESGHFDGAFAYAVRCRNCGAVWEMPAVVFPRKSERADLLVVELETEDA
jgi:uncharacterized Zn finger protein